MIGLLSEVKCVHKADMRSGSTSRISPRDIEPLMTVLRDPWLMDVNVSEREARMGSSFNSSLNRLTSEGIISMGYLPSLWIMGGDILGLNVTTTPTLQHLDPDGICAGDLFPYRMVKVRDRDTNICLSIFPSFTHYDTIFSRWKTGISNAKYDVDIRTTLMPCSSLCFHDMFSFDGVIGRRLGRPPSGEGGLHEIVFHGEKVPMNAHRKIIMKGLVQNPNLSNLSIAKNIGVNRRSVSKFRKFAKEKGMIHPLIVPDFKRFDLELMGTVQLGLDGMKLKDKKGVLSGISGKIRDFSFLNVSSLDNQLILTAHRDFNEFQSDMRYLREMYEKEDILRPGVHITAVEVKENLKLGVETFNEKYF